MKQVFEDNPSLDLCYKTSDGTHFFLESDATNHAKNLKDKAVIKLTRNQETKDDEAEGTENETEQKTQELLALELIGKNYNQMKALAKFFDLEVEGNKADDYIKALEAYKQQISEK